MSAISKHQLEEGQAGKHRGELEIDFEYNFFGQGDLASPLEHRLDYRNFGKLAKRSRRLSDQAPTVLRALAILCVRSQFDSGASSMHKTLTPIPEHAQSPQPNTRTDSPGTCDYADRSRYEGEWRDSLVHSFNDEYSHCSVIVTLVSLRHLFA